MKSIIVYELKTPFLDHRMVSRAVKVITGNDKEIDQMFNSIKWNNTPHNNPNIQISEMYPNNTSITYRCINKDGKSGMMWELVFDTEDITPVISDKRADIMHICEENGIELLAEELDELENLAPDEDHSDYNVYLLEFIEKYIFKKSIEGEEEHA